MCWKKQATKQITVDGRQAMIQLEREREMIDLVITDVRMPGLTGDELPTTVRARRAEAPVIIITAFGSVEQAVELVRAGAFRYLTKPFKNSELLKVVTAALAHSEAQRAQARLRREIKVPTRIIGASRPMRALFEQITIAARGVGTVLITGESGTGKELVARAIHEASQRSGGAFVPVNCAAIPGELMEAELFGHTGTAFTGAKQARKGLMETAENGSLFLDEIGELPLPIQPKLLRALQDKAIRAIGSNTERSVNVRVIAATNRDLEKDVGEGRFRQDLFWRLNVLHLHVPALRERAYDVPLLVEYFIAKACEAAERTPLAVTPEALALLTAYSWPGNVRELENALERAVAFAEGASIAPEDLPQRVRTNGSTAALLARSSEQAMTLREVEREYILDILRRTGGNKLKASQMLGLDRKTLYRKLEEYQAEDSATL
ncbi:MAG: sigma-54 dependent transcriptional regulator [Blastocatellia bacterium]